MLDERETQSCAVCGRTILRGERVASYVAPEGGEVQVCALCKPRAEASGWLPPGFGGEVAQSQVRRRQRGGMALRERLVRRGQAHAPRDAEPPAPPPPPPDPIEVFNASAEARKVAGLRRSLGEPRVCVREQRSGGRLITVAWDLSWYQWRVVGTAVEQVGKGDEISELPIDARAWNATAAEDGTLHLG